MKEIGELTPFFYPNQVLDKKKSGERKKKPETAGGDQKSERNPFRIYGYYQQTGSTEAERAGFRGGPV